MHNSSFDSTERKALANAEFFHTKSAIDVKINALFVELKAEIEKELKSAFNALPEGFPTTGGRIHRGEHYGPFPWRAVDCPAGFKKDGFLAFRSLLLWGHHFSFHLFLSGKWLAYSLDRLCAALPILQQLELQLSVQKSFWEWEFDSDTHIPLSDCTPQRIRSLAEESDGLKLSRLLPLDAADSLVSTGLLTWKTIQQQLFVD